ncbi:uncharacterized protein LOC126901027 [Daktulosphaira vitifoliae]|uniref:uncharacterized protein LOC126901027 n=1 Tax=Daktulosphaira vitifoliae TaxID=58002 RepID=UPI0021AA30A4|nr:uncharacterized protein LOC126901027 [Daktulosphaira vitifoliae]
MANIFGRIMKIAKKKLGLRKKCKVTSVDCGSQTNKLIEDINIQSNSLPETHDLESQIKEVEDITVQASLLTSEKLTQTNTELMFDVSETQTELLNSLNCETQTEVSLENIILNTKLFYEPLKSIPKLKNYIHTGSQCCILDTINEPINSIKESSLKVNNFVEDGVIPTTTNDSHEMFERYVTKGHLTTKHKFEQDSCNNARVVEEFKKHDLQSCTSLPLEASMEVNVAYDLSNVKVDRNKRYLNKVVGDKPQGAKVDNGLHIYTLENIPQLKLSDNYVYSMRVLYCQEDYFCMTKVKDEKMIRSMEKKMNAYYKQTQECNFKPRHDELCAVKYSDGRWYRGVCIDIENSVDRNQFYIINLIDWEESVSVTSSELRRLETFYMKHAPLAVKCIILDFKLSNAHKKNLRKLENNEYKCKINLRLSPRNFLISSKTILDILRNR